MAESKTETISTITKPNSGLGLLRWSFCVLLAAAPFVFFILCLELFASNSIPQDGLLNTGTWESAAGTKSPHANENGAIYLFQYAVMNFVHTLICISVGAYFLFRFKALTKPGVKLILCGLFACAVLFVLYLQLGPDTTFYAYMVDPILNIINTVQVPRPHLLAANNSAFLKGALLWPTTLGIIVVLLASGAFHARIFAPDETIEDNNKQEKRKETEKIKAILENKFHDLKQDFFALALVLVSSAMTAHMFFSFPEALLIIPKDDAPTAAVKYYQDLSGALSFATGLLFSATLIAAFAPGFFNLIMSPQSGAATPAKPAKQAETFFETLKFATEGFRKIWKSVAAILAPILASPAFEIINGFISG